MSQFSDFWRKNEFFLSIIIPASHAFLPHARRALTASESSLLTDGQSVIIFLNRVYYREMNTYYDYN